ncbi:glycosyltransferase [Eubacteriaceae bacterium ES2]|nr:glycosyltransferase [Eubacteriaceae bacterium ES2]
MKVLHVLNTGKISGAENVASDICMMFKDEFEMAYCSRQGSIREALDARGVKFLPISNLTVKELARVVEEFSPDLIHAHDVRATVVASRLSLPFISHLHVNNDDMKKITLKALLYRMTAKKAKKIIAVSDSCLNDYIFASAIKNKTVVMNNIIYSRRLEKLTETAVPEKIFDFLFLGRLVDQKNPQRVARVAAGVLKKRPTSSFAVIGEGDLKAQMEAIFIEAGVNDRVVFTGNLASPYGILKNARCLLFCSRFEGTPIAALEAMFFGVPIVSTPTDGLLRLIEHEQTGYLWDQDEDLIKSILRLIDDQACFREIALASHERFKVLNQEGTYHDQLKAIYQSIK